LSFYRGPWTVLFAGAGGGERLSPGPEFFAAFQQALEDGDLEQALGLLRQLAAQAAERESLELDSVRDAFFRLLLAGVEVAWSRKLEETTCFWREIREHSSLAGLAGFVESNLRTMFAGQEAGGRCPRKIAEIRRYIRANYPRPELDLQGIAAHSGLSRTYLSHLFKEATGENLSEYITRLRVEQAKRLLRDPGLKSYEVAARVGWTDASYFAAIFRRHVGLSPTEYRQRGEG
jgi:two-component system response regulator YesN